MHSFFFLLRTYLTKYTLNIYYLNSDEIVNILLSNNKKSTKFFFNNGGIYMKFYLLTSW